MFFFRAVFFFGDSMCGTCSWMMLDDVFKKIQCSPLLGENIQLDHVAQTS